MLKTKALRKIFITTLSMFILLFIFSLSVFNEVDVVRTNFEIEDITGIVTDDIYLINSNGLLVKNSIFIDSNKIEDKILEILNNLYEKSNSQVPNGLFGVIPSDVSINSYNFDEGIVTIDFSKELLNVTSDRMKIVITSIVYSLTELNEIDGVVILVDGELLDDYDSVLNRNIGINNKYLFNTRTNISKVVVYYLEEIDNSLYYVPVTKYLNDDRDKIKIIIEELTTSYIYEPNLMSFLDTKLKLVDYREEGDVLFLNFNDYFFDSGNKVLEEVVYSIAYSVFDSYDVNMIMFEVENEKVKSISRSDL